MGNLQTGTSGNVGPTTKTVVLLSLRLAATSKTGVERELTDPRQSSRPYRKTTLKFDDDGRLIKRVDEDSLGVSTTTNVWVSGRLQDQNVSHHRNDGKFANWNEWQRWTYDKNGRLAEFKAGRDKQERCRARVNGPTPKFPSLQKDYFEVRR